MEYLENYNHMARILIIDDDEGMRSMLNDFFAEEGFETDSVNNGSEAFRKLTEKVFDLIITDIRMPGLTGLDILPGMRKLQPKTPIVVITAFGSADIRHRAFERGATIYLEKPIYFHELRKIIHEMFFLKEKQ
jgi:DNA-binding NtrC family response regulator